MLSSSSVADPVRILLDAQVRHASKLVGYANIAVAIGVAMEGLEIAYDAAEWWKRRKRAKRERSALDTLADVFPAGELTQPTESHSKEPRWIKRFLRIGLLVVVVGVVSEWRCGERLEDAHNAVHAYDIGKLTEADQKAGAAKDSADAVAKEYDDLLDKYTKAEKELIALKAEHSARRLSSKQKEKLRQRVAAFSVKTIRLSCINAGDEAFDLMKDFVDAFGHQNSPLKLEPWRTGCDRIEGVGAAHFPPIGIHAGTARQEDAVILLKALVEVGIDKKQISSQTASVRNVLELVIGPHAQWAP